MLSLFSAVGSSYFRASARTSRFKSPPSGKSDCLLVAFAAESLYAHDADAPRGPTRGSTTGPCLGRVRVEAARVVRRPHLCSGRAAHSALLVSTERLSSDVPVASHEAPLCACGVVEPRRDGSVPSTWSSSAPNLTELPVSAVLCSGSLGNVPVALHVRIGRLPVCPLSDGRLKHMEPVLARQIH